MDLYKVIKDLHQELKRIDHEISAAAKLAAQSEKPKSRRGRKAMSEAERKAVSRRMKAYWEARKKNQSP